MSGTTDDESQAGVTQDEAGPRLKCYLQSEGGDGSDANPSGDDAAIGTTYLEQEKGKKSSFLLESPAPTSGSQFYSIPAPCVVVIQGAGPISGDVPDVPFFLGGFQLVSTAKSVEVHLTDSEGKESYLMTSKGIPVDKDDTAAEWHKAICVVPGGPRPISRLRVKLLCLRPADASVGKLRSMKLTARIAEPPSPAEATAPAAAARGGEVASSTDASSLFGASSCTSASGSPIRPNSGRGKQLVMSPGSAPITQSDLGAAMAGVSFLARSTEKEIGGVLHEQTKRLENHVETCFSRMEHQLYSLQSILLVQQQLLQENQSIMQQQQRRIDDQNMQLGELVRHQKDLQVRVQSLQADVSILRFQVPEDIVDDEVHAFENDERLDESNAIGADYKLDESIPGVVIPLEEEESCQDLLQGEKVVATRVDEVNPHVVPLESSNDEVAISAENAGNSCDESHPTIGLPLPSTDQDLPTLPHENAAVTPDKPKETANEGAGEALMNDSSLPRKKSLQTGEMDERCNFVANIEVTLLEDDPPSVDDDEDEDNTDGEKEAAAMDNMDGFNEDGQTHEGKEEDPLDRARHEFFDSFASQLQQEQKLAVVNPSSCWTAPFQCVPLTVEDVIM